MIRYSSHRYLSYQPPTVQAADPELEIEYHERLQLRECVRKTEATAALKRVQGPSVEGRSLMQIISMARKSYLNFGRLGEQ